MLAGTLAILAWLHFHYPDIRDSNRPLSNAGLYSLTLVLSTSVVILALRSRGIVTRVLSHPVLVYLGTISYTVYLVHVTFIGLMWKFNYGKYSSALAALALTLAFATASWFLLEKRLVRGEKRRSGLSSVALARD